MDNIEQTAAEMLSDTENIVLASLDGDGYPRPVPMNRLANDGLRTVWMTTEYHGRKARHFRADPRAGLCFYTRRGSVVLRGTVEILRDETARKKFWQEGFSRYFPGGADDPQYCILRFTAQRAKCWVDGAFHELPELR